MCPGQSCTWLTISGTLSRGHSIQDAFLQGAMPSLRRTPCLFLPRTFPDSGDNRGAATSALQVGPGTQRPGHLPAPHRGLGSAKTTRQRQQGAPRGGNPEETGDEGPTGRNHSRTDPFAEMLPQWGHGCHLEGPREAEPSASLSNSAGNRWPSLGGQTSTRSGSLPQGGRAQGAQVSVDTELPLLPKMLNKERAKLIYFSFLSLFGF